MTLEFTKMQGLGNDFVVIDATTMPFTLNQAAICKMADRRFGVGFDQLLLLEPSADSSADFNYRIFNANGNEVDQCGNGARCLAVYIKDKGLCHRDAIILQTSTTRMKLSVVANGDVSVEMTTPLFKPAEIPFVTSEARLPYHLDIGGEVVEFGVVNVGNPHAVILIDDIDAAPIVTIGKQLADHQSFPQGVNVGFMQIISKHEVNLRVRERGAGETLACGSGACAAVAYGRSMGLLSKRVKVNQAGGSLEIIWPGAGEKLVMIGPGQLVYYGKWLV